MVDKADKVDSFGRTSQPSTVIDGLQKYKSLEKYSCHLRARNTNYVKRKTGIETLEFLLDDIRRPYGN
jgi:hypothetical protein